MGEKIRDIAKGKLLGANFELELNHPTISGQDEQIHLQSDKFRFEMDKRDFIKYSLAVLLAEKNLKNIKGIK